MIAEFFEFLLSGSPTPDPSRGVIVLGALILCGLLPAILFKPTAARVLLGLLAIAFCYVVDFILSAAIVISQNLDLDRFPASIELVLYGFITLGWLIGAAVRGLVGRYGGRRSIFSKVSGGAIDLSRFARAHSRVAIRFSALVFLVECALLLMPYLTLVASEHARPMHDVMSSLFFLGLPLGLSAFIARGRPLGAWTLGVALNVLMWAWQTQIPRVPAPPWRPRSLADYDSDTFLLVFVPTQLAALATAARWLWIGFTWLIEMARRNLRPNQDIS